MLPARYDDDDDDEGKERHFPKITADETVYLTIHTRRSKE